MGNFLEKETQAPPPPPKSSHDFFTSFCSGWRTDSENEKKSKIERPVFAREARENTQTPGEHPYMQVVLGVLTLRGGTRYVSCYGMPNLT